MVVEQYAGVVPHQLEVLQQFPKGDPEQVRPRPHWPLVDVIEGESPLDESQRVCFNGSKHLSDWNIDL